ncbi:MAG: lipid-binding SYLF domain-containing protein [Methylacidiphilales bacterium]|nr:lipid-binding SYLF domain-containing protein [Candidatus Methylacidiphilales bacterium]
MKKYQALLAIFLAAALPLHAEALSDRIDEAISILEAKQESAHPIPQKLLNDCKGIAIIRVARGGVVFGGTHGTGIVLGHTQKLWGTGWSAPCAFSMSGGSFGAQIGFETRDYIFVLNTNAALRMFTSDESLKWDATAAATAGPDYVSAENSQVLEVPIYYYTKTDGAFAGATFGGTSLSTDSSTNREAYGHGVLTSDILNGRIKPHKDSASLYKLLGGK